MFGRRGISEDGLNPHPRSPEIRPSQPESPQPPAASPPVPSEPAPAPGSAPDELRPSSNVIPVASAIPRTVPLRSNVNDAAPRIYPLVLQRIDTEVAAKLQRDELSRQLADMVSEIVVEQRIQLNQSEQRQLVIVLLDDMLGLGPLEPLLADESITDIMVNGAKQVYVERRGKLELTGVTFRDNAHVMSIATRIVTQVGRRIDESTPLVDARLQDGSRVNIIIPPLAIDGPTISIRKFSKKGITLDVMSRQKNISAAMATVLKIAARSRLNILISGGTGSGKTTLLNAMSQMIDPRRAHRHHRRRGRVAAAAAACGAARNPARQPRRQGRNHHARPSQERAAHAPRPHHPRRNSRRRGDRHAAGDEHRP